MPRSYVLGNGNVLLGFDERAQARDWFFPYAGLDSHLTSDRTHRLGIFAEGKMHWLFKNGWDISTQYRRDSLVAITEARNSTINIKLEILDAVYNEKDVFLRRVRIYNNRKEESTVKLFFNQEFVIYSTSSGNTAFFDPFENAVIHYKGRRVFLVSGKIGTERMCDYSVGFSHFNGREGTWRDADDGVLSQNPIEHGSVDSTVAFAAKVKGRSYRTVYYWVAMAETVEEAIKLNHYIHTKSPQHLIKSTTDFWRAWVNKQNFNFFNLPPTVIDQFKRSLLIVRTHDDNRGGIIASGDSQMLQGGQDSYVYVWPRDAAYTAMALDSAGYFDLTKRFFNYMRTLLRKEGYLMHKYRPDGSLGSSWHPWIINGKAHLPIQEDETATVLYALWKHYNARRDIDYIEEIFNSFIKAMADFMVSYRDPGTKLPLPSYDLWEERLGVSTYTAATVFGALMAATNFSHILGKHKLAREYETAAHEIQEAIGTHLYNKEQGTFYKMLELQEGKLVPNPTIDASSVFGIIEYQVFPINDPRVQSAFKVTTETLFDHAPIGGCARYENDHYNETIPGVSNPWIICTLWAAHAYIHQARTLDDMQPVLKIFKWVAEHANKAGLLPEQLHPETGTGLSVTPLTWSHAEFVRAVLEYLTKLEELGICKTCSPLILHFR